MKNDSGFYKRKAGETILWKNGGLGEWLFSFDGIKIYNMFRDYPHNMTPDEVRIFDNENPEWASFFSDRKRVK